MGLVGHGKDQAQWSRNTFPNGCLVARHSRGWKARNRHLQCPPEPSQRRSGLQPTHRAQAHSTCPPIAGGFSYKELPQEDNFEELKRINA